MSLQSQQQYLERLISQIKNKPQNAETLYAEHAALWKELEFTQTQVALWLASLALDSKPLSTRNGVTQSAIDLEEHLIALLQQQSGKRMLLAQVLKKLPVGVVSSEQHIRKLAQQNEQLEIKGPFLVLIN